jgi:DNA-binding CsgD family transcriptional regulator
LALMSARGTELLERSTELEAIAAALERAEGGAGSVVLIEGEAGIGKTELLCAARGLGTDAGVAVLTARASELERDYSYGLVRQLFQAPLIELDPDERAQALSGAAALAGAMLDVAGAAADESAQDGFARLHGLHWLCANLAETQPLMLAVDDIQWSDTESLRFLHYLAGRLEDLPVVVVATLRTGEPDPPEALLAQLRSETMVGRVRPSPLSLDATVTFVREHVGADAEPRFCAACRDATRGNPLLLTELARALMAEGIGTTDADADRVSEIGGRGLAERLLARIDRLGPDALAVARAVAILEPHATLRRVAGTADLEQRAATAAAHALVGAGVLDDGSPLRFSHPLLRAAVEAALTEPQRRELHATAAEIHHAEDGDPGVVASHLVRTDAVEGDWVVSRLREAAEQALGRGASEPATAFARRALDEPLGEELRVGLMRLLGSALIRAGDEEGIDWLTRARNASDDPELRGWIAEEVGPSLLIRGRVQEGVASMQESIAEFPNRGELRLVLLAGQIRAAYGGYEDAFAEPFEQLREAMRGVDAGTIERRLAHQALAFAGALGLMSCSETRRHALLALGDEDGVREAAALGRPLDMAAMALCVSGDTGPAVKACAVGVEWMRRRATRFGLSSQLGTQAWMHLSRGDVISAAMDADEAQGLGAAGVPMVSPVIAGVRIAIALEQADLGGAERIVIDTGVAGDLPTNMVIGSTLVARARLRLAQGRASEALDDLMAGAEMFHGVGALGPDLLPPRIHVALALSALGRETEARERAAAEERWAREIENPRLIGEALRVRGLVEGGAGIDALREAVEVLAPTDFRLNHARALVDLGAALRRAKERRASRDPLREGMELAHRCGATALEERGRIELEATGARPRSVMLTGAESLTPSELRVARLAVEGKTNREVAQLLFVSPKTVETHLRHCYQKLEIDGRAHLASALTAAD